MFDFPGFSFQLIRKVYDFPGIIFAFFQTKPDFFRFYGYTSMYFFKYFKLIWNSGFWDFFTFPDLLHTDILHTHFFLYYQYIFPYFLKWFISFCLWLRILTFKLSRIFFRFSVYFVTFPDSLTLVFTKNFPAISPGFFGFFPEDFLDLSGFHSYKF